MAGEGEAPLGPAVRDRIMRQFGAWLDTVLARESAPGGMDQEILDRVTGNEGHAATAKDAAPADLYSVVAGLAALTTEVKLQGRTFKDLREALESANDTGEPLRRLAATIEETLVDRDQQQAREVEHRTQASLLSVLLDVRDRLERGRTAARRHLQSAPKPYRKRRLFGLLARRGDRRQDGDETAAVRALEEGYALGLARLDAALRDIGVEPVVCVPGTAFDPHTMNAVKVEETREQAEGTVRELYRTGYRWNGDVFRTAEVSVARSPSEREDSHVQQP
jgi:molecular chaperone GrpE (heat shock protein)